MGSMGSAAPQCWTPTPCWRCWGASPWPPSSCSRSEVWHCMSGIMEGGVKYVKSPGDIYRAVQPVLYKAVFHGGLKSMWSSVMEIGEMRSMGRCIQEHDECVEHNILSHYL